MRYRADFSLCLTKASFRRMSLKCKPYSVHSTEKGRIILLSKTKRHPIGCLFILANNPNFDIKFKHSKTIYYILTLMNRTGVFSFPQITVYILFW